MRLFTGLQPSGALHIGNYFGVLKQTVDLFKEADGLIMVADYHALTSLKKPEELRNNIRDVVRDYVGVGIDPAKAAIFQQSAV
ncbi:MAG TPA: tryptophan--tRNA ligase, partial [Candidatus Paceibacterota bacterium]|nr:tryptophan--tRNA ligase [Candidatus Paceibacterota bacterium]